MSDGKTAVLTRKSPLEKFASFCGSAAAWLAALVLFGLAAASLIARMDLLDVSTLAEGKALRVGQRCKHGLDRQHPAVRFQRTALGGS